MSHYSTLKRIGVASLALAALVGAFVFRPAVAHGTTQARPFSSTDCKNTTACASFENISTGAGVASISTRGSGVIASTYYSSTSPSNGAAGLLGEDYSSSGVFDSGVEGQSAIGTGVWGDATGAGTGVVAEADGTKGQALDAFNASASVATVSLSNSGGGFLLAAMNPARSADVLTLDSAGNLDVMGQLQHNGHCFAGCSAPVNGHPGAAVVSYASQSAEPMIEDFGEARLVDGVARVALDPAFANAIARHATYLVFITPQGDSKGLYVTEKSLAGFVVREDQDGRSTLAFDYRIVAQPYGVSAPRLPMVPIAPPNTSR